MNKYNVLKHMWLSCASFTLFIGVLRNLQTTKREICLWATMYPSTPEKDVERAVKHGYHQDLKSWLYELGIIKQKDGEENGRK